MIACKNHGLCWPISIAMIIASHLFIAGVMATQVADTIIKARVAYVIDGDSIMTRYEGRFLEVRLWGIDAPEYNQPGGENAKHRLKKLVEGNVINLTIKDRDKYGRMVALVSSGGQIVNEEMVRTGNSWVYDYYCREQICSDWVRLEEKARRDRIGLWKDRSPIPPWRWKSDA